MDRTFIKTSQGIIRIEHITFIRFWDEEIHIYSMDSLGSVVLTGKEAQSFLQFIPIAVDLTYLAKKEPEALLGVEVAGMKM